MINPPAQEVGPAKERVQAGQPHEQQRLEGRRDRRRDEDRVDGESPAPAKTTLAIPRRDDALVSPASSRESTAPRRSRAAAA